MKHLLPMVFLLALAACDGPVADGPFCGNGVLENGEDCDNGRFAPVVPATCVEAGYNDGVPACENCVVNYRPCVPYGRCGDGVRDAPYEECDGREFGAVTCESLGHHAGVLTCSRDCRIVDSPCKRCGDGVLQPGFGELVELSTEACMDAGFFGGVMTTADCQTASTAYCGNYRLLTEGSSLLSPVFTWDDSDGLLIAGVVQGTLTGFDNPGCPDLTEFYYYGPSPEDPDEWVDRFGGYFYPSCRDHFFATLTSAPGLQPHYQKDISVNVTSIVDLGDQGLAFLRDAGSGGNLLDLVDREGNSRFLMELEYYPTRSATPPVLRISEDELAIVTIKTPDEMIKIRRFSLSGNRILETVALEDITWNEYGYQWGEQHVFHALWRPDGRPLFVLNLKKGSSGIAGTYLLSTKVEAGRLVVDDLTPLHVSMASAAGVHLLPDANTIEVCWFEVPLNAPVVMHVDRWNLRGIQTGQAAVVLPEGYTPRTAVRTPEGNWLLAGAAYLTEYAPGMPVTCEGPGDNTVKMHLFAFLVSPAGTILDSQHFYSSAFMEVPFAGNLPETICQVSRQYFHTSGNTVLVGGTYDRSRFFCTPDELVTRVDLDPLHACGIWLVKLELTP